MSFLFNTTLINKKNWLEAIKNTVEVNNLITYIFEKEKIRVSSLYPLTPSTNAVYRVGCYVIKVFAPEIIGYPAEEEFKREIYMLMNLELSGIKAPRLYSKGIIEDKYVFYYLITEFITDSITASKFLINSKPHVTYDFLINLQLVIDKIHQIKADNNLTQLLSRKTACYLKGELEFERVKLVNNFLITKSPSKNVFVHTDLSGDNILINKNHEIIIIDFEDWMYSNEAIELPAIVFELLNNTVYVKELINVFNYCDIIEELFMGLLMHPSCQQYLRQICRDFNKLKSLTYVKEMLYQRYLSS